MLRHAIPLVIAGLCLAQNPGDLFEKAPPDVEQAIRARIAKFYEAYQIGKFRMADAVVHDDSKDEFFESEKTKIKAFEIGKITYSDNFTKASVTTILDQDYTTQFGRIPIKLPMTTRWKLDKGEWWWYTTKFADDEYYSTIFGRVKKPKNGVAGGEVPERKPAGGIVPPPMTDPVKLLGGVRADKSEVQLSGSPASGTVVIQNQMPGDIILRVQMENAWPGLTATLDKTQLRSEDKATLMVRDTTTGGQTSAAVAKVIVAPTQRVIAIRILPAATP